MIIHVKFQWNQTTGFREVDFYIIGPGDLVFNWVKVVFSNFVRESHKDHSSEVSMEFDSWLQSWLLKVFT